MSRFISAVRHHRIKVARVMLFVIAAILSISTGAFLLERDEHTLNDRELVLAVIGDDKSMAFNLLARGVSPNMRWADLTRPTTPEYLRYRMLRMDPRQHMPAVTSLGPTTPTLLIIAIGNRDTVLAKKLIFCGADVNAIGYTFVRVNPKLRIRRPGYIDRKTTPLIEAARVGDIDLAMSLLALGAKVDAATSDGDTPAYYVGILPKSAGSSRLLRALSRRSVRNQK